MPSHHFDTNTPSTQQNGGCQQTEPGREVATGSENHDHAPYHKSKRRRSARSEPLSRVDTGTLSSFSTIEPAGEEDHDGLWTRMVRNPLAFIAFIFSLSYVDWRERAWRIRQRAERPGSGWGGWWGEPWQKRDGQWCVDVKGQGSRPDVGQQEYGRTGSWPIRKKLRRMARLEIRDALEMKDIVLIVLLVVAISAMVSSWLVFRWLWRYART